MAMARGKRQVHLPRWLTPRLLSPPLRYLVSSQLQERPPLKALGDRGGVQP